MLRVVSQRLFIVPEYHLFSEMNQPHEPLISPPLGSSEVSLHFYQKKIKDKLDNGSKLCQGRFRLSIRKHFSEWVVKYWNRVPREVPKPVKIEEAFGQCP